MRASHIPILMQLFIFVPENVQLCRDDSMKLNKSHSTVLVSNGEDADLDGLQDEI